MLNSGFRIKCEAHHLALLAASPFSADGNPPNAVRIYLGGPANAIEMKESRHLVADMIDHLHSPVL